jgi:hypothetical protein
LDDHGDEDALDHDADDGFGGGEPGLQGGGAILDEARAAIVLVQGDCSRVTMRQKRPLLRPAVDRIP